MYTAEAIEQTSEFWLGHHSFVNHNINYLDTETVSTPVIDGVYSNKNDLKQAIISQVYNFGSSALIGKSNVKDSTTLGEYPHYFSGRNATRVVGCEALDVVGGAYFGHNRDPNKIWGRITARGNSWVEYISISESYDSCKIPWELLKGRCINEYSGERVGGGGFGYSVVRKASCKSGYKLENDLCTIEKVPCLIQTA
jgi:hypothetical protein